MLFNLIFASNTIWLWFFLVFLFIDYLILAVIAKFFNHIAELRILIGIPTKEAKAEMDVSLLKQKRESLSKLLFKRLCVQENKNHTNKNSFQTNHQDVRGGICGRTFRTNRGFLQHLNFCRCRNSGLQQTVVEPEIQNNHSYEYDEGHNDGHQERFYRNEIKVWSSYSWSLRNYHSVEKKYIHATNRCFWEEIYWWNHTSLQSMGE